MHNWIEPFREMVDCYRSDSGRKGLAALCDDAEWDYEITRKEVGPYDTHKLGFEKAMRAIELCAEKDGEKSRAVLDKIQTVFFAEHHARPAKADINELVAKAVKEVSDVVSANATAASHGGYSPNDTKRIRKEILEAISALMLVEEGVEAQFDGAQHLRAVGSR
jgi:hypothetical protein